MAPPVGIEVGQQWSVIGAPDDWVEIAGLLPHDEVAVITATGDIATIATAMLLDSYTIRH